MNQLIYIPTGKVFLTTHESKTTTINAYISMFNRTKKVSNGIGEIIIKDYLTFNKSRKAVRNLWEIKQK
tara:strand:+ start:148 stop:354 length:207 start_codon:yes stop_codon:yes gene_type:complete